jgi:tryptophan synthase alpha chain
MNRIDQKFLDLRKRNKKALITFTTAGHPSIEKTKEIILLKEAAGADIIEIGIPFSDPLADGPVIQASSMNALKNGLKVKDVFQMVEELREITEVPLIFLVYFNTIFNYGKEAFVKKCQAIGIDGLIIPDLPFEEEDEIIEFLDDTLHLIPLVSPVSKDRVKKIVNQKKGFIYCITSLGTTGQAGGFYKNTKEYLESVREVSDLPIAIGFGIKTTDQIQEFIPYIDGYIVGSRIVDCIDKNSNNLSRVVKLVSSLVL